jgi:hypothetical protein
MYRALPVWSSGMILPSGGSGHEFDSRLRPYNQPRTTSGSFPVQALTFFSGLAVYQVRLPLAMAAEQQCQPSHSSRRQTCAMYAYCSWILLGIYWARRMRVAEPHILVPLFLMVSLSNAQTFQNVWL